MPHSGPGHLSPSTIDAIAAGVPVGERDLVHAESCPRCQREVEQARADRSYLDRVRSLTASTLAPEGAPSIPGYRVEGAVGGGAQALIYRAVQLSTSRDVAVKVIREGETQSSSWQAAREAEIAAGLRHPGIVTVYESRLLKDGRLALVMEFVKGVPLDRWHSPSSSTETKRADLLAVFVRVCEAVHHAHLNGVIHRDLKPDNILVREGGAPVVLDFGIARRGEAMQTQTGAIAATPAYASPEQVAGNPRAVDALTDVYSLGVLLHRVLSSQFPYPMEGSLLAIARSIEQSPPTPLRQIDPSISPDLEAIALHALQKDKRDRYQSAAALAQDVQRYLNNQPVEARSASGLYLLRKAISVNRRRIGLASAAALVLAGALVIAGIGLSNAQNASRREAQQREQARQDQIRLRAVSELLRQTLPAADPRHPEIGSAVSAGLARLYLNLESGAYASEPELDQEIRRLWGRVYTGLGHGKGAGLVEYAEVSLRNGLMRARTAHPDADTPEIASLLHELAGVLLVRSRLVEADRVCTETIDMRARLFGSESAEHLESLALRAQILLANGNHDEASTTADRVLSRSENRAAPYSVAMVAIKARAALDRADGPGAEPLVLEALAARLGTMAPDQPQLLESIEQFADLLDLAPSCDSMIALIDPWRESKFADDPAAAIRADAKVLRQPQSYLATPLGRTRALGRLLRLQEAMLGPDHPAAVGVLMAQTRAAAGEGLLAERISALLRSADILSNRFGDSDLAVLMCIDEAAVVCAFSGDTAQAVALAEQADAIWRAIPASARDPLLSTNAKRRLAWFLQLDGQSGRAEKLYRVVVSDLSSQLGVDHYLVQLARGGLALALLAQREPEEARQQSRIAAQIETLKPTPPLDTLAHVCFARGHVLVATGSPEEARHHLQLAWDSFYESGVGTMFPWRDALIADMISVHERLDDLAQADLWRAKHDGGTLQHSPP